MREDNDPLLLPHLQEAARLIVSAAKNAAKSPEQRDDRRTTPRAQVIHALRRLIAYLAGKTAPVGRPGMQDENRCDLCFREVYDRSRPELCRHCRGEEAEKSKADVEAEDEGHQKAIAAHEARVAEGLKRVPRSGSPREADMGGTPHARRKQERPKDRPHVTDPVEARRLLARLLRDEGGTATPADLWRASEGRLRIEQVLALLRHDWFEQNGDGWWRLSSFARTEYLNRLASRKTRARNS